MGRLFHLGLCTFCWCKIDKVGSLFWWMCGRILFSMVTGFCGTTMGLTLQWVQAEVHVDSQEISCYLNSAIWSRYKPNRENCILYRTLVYSVCCSLESLSVEKPSSNSVMGERIRGRASDRGTETERVSASSDWGRELVTSASVEDCWRKLTLWADCTPPPTVSKGQPHGNLLCM